MKLEIKTKLILLILSFMMLMCGMISNPLQTKAATVSSTGITFDEHNGMVIHISGVGDAYCIQRGYPFRTRVSDLQMCYTTYEGEMVTLADWIRKMLVDVDWEDGFQTRYFCGWGLWELNETHTGATNITTDKSTIPSSGAWEEEFDEETVDGEDDYVNDSNNSTVFEPYTKTGHEGSKAPYATEVIQIENTLSQSRLNALAMANYYIYDAPDVSGFGTYAKRQVASALSWAAEFGFLDSIGSGGNNVIVTFNTSTGKYKSGGKLISGTMSCDAFIKLYIGNQYDAMKLYRMFVWKMTNLRTIPSFSYNSYDVAKANPIKLRWDESENAYTATINDENGVLDYFKFSLSGITVTDNGDGTLTLKSTKPIDGTITSDASASTMLPSDCTFTLPITYRWKLEGDTKTFYYTVLIKDRDADDPVGSRPDGSTGERFNHNWEWGCEWYCTNFRGIDHCDNEDNAGYFRDHTHEPSCSKDIWGNYNCNDLPLNADYKEVHEHDDDCEHGTHCDHSGQDKHDTGTPSSTCSVAYHCLETHWKIETGKTIDGTYRDFQDIIVWGEGEDVVLVDPVYAYISVVTEDPHTYESETSAEVQLIDQDGNVVDHIKVGEIYKVRYIFTYEGASKKEKWLHHCGFGELNI